MLTGVVAFKSEQSKRRSRSAMVSGKVSGGGGYMKKSLGALGLTRHRRIGPVGTKRSRRKTPQEDSNEKRNWGSQKRRSRGVFKKAVVVAGRRGPSNRAG